VIDIGVCSGLFVSGVVYWQQKGEKRLEIPKHE
jgi:hypothetical protein